MEPPATTTKAMPQTQLSPEATVIWVQRETRLIWLTGLCSPHEARSAFMTPQFDLSAFKCRTALWECRRARYLQSADLLLRKVVGRGAFGP